MKRFKFSLQTVRALRDIRRDEAERAFARSTAEAALAREELERTRRTRASAIEAYLSTLQAGHMDPGEAAQRSAYLELLGKIEAAAAARLVSVETICEEKRKGVTLAAQNAEVTEKLYEQQRARHFSEVARGEQIDLDELSTNSGLRRMGQLS
jgi:flagellar export protein FliJ